MRRISLFVFTIIFINSVLIAKEAPNTSNATQALVTVITYNDQNKIIASGNGFFINGNGEAVASYKQFKGAQRAVVIDSKGKEWKVKRILGANDMLNLVKFNIEGKEVKSLEPAAETAKKEETLYIVSNYPKKGTVLEAKITDETPYSGSAYYTLSIKDQEKNENSPVLNAEGKVVAITQKNVKKDATNACAIGIKLAMDLQINELSLGNSSLLGIGITKAIPSSQEKALTYLYLLSNGSVDSTTHVTALNDYIEAYPQSHEGYTERAVFYASRYDFSKSEADFDTALKVSQRKDEVHYTFSKLLYNKALYAPLPAYKDWDLNKALAETEKAYAVQPYEAYLIMQGKCLYGLKDYEKAFQVFNQVNKTNFASADTYYYAAKAKEKIGADIKELIVLLDSAIGKYSKPYSKDVAPYIFDRAIKYSTAKMYREAVLDFNEYEHLVGYKNLTGNFYYLRSQAEIEARMYQQAIDDIDRAINLSPKEYLYQVEKSSLMLRTAQISEAIKAAQNAININADETDAYRILGIIYGETKDKVKAAEYLNKAKEKGDSSAEDLIKKYVK